MANAYETLAAVDVSRHVEKKNGFSYVSWSHALHELLKRYPRATWGHDEWGPEGSRVPYVKAPGRGYLVRAWCEVEGVRRSVQHAVTDHKNQPIPEPSCADISNSIQRAVVKAIALHGLGLSVYAGEDLPLDVSSSSAGRSEERRSGSNGETRGRVAANPSAPDVPESGGDLQERVKAALKAKGVTTQRKAKEWVSGVIGVELLPQLLSDEEARRVLAALGGEP